MYRAWAPGAAAGAAAGGEAAAPACPACPPSTSSSAAAGAGGEGEKTCRICLDDEGDDFIAPCACKGTQRYVHRSCLDRWRATREGLAFSQCGECKTRYILRCPKRSDDDGYRRWKFRLLVLRDLVIVVLLVQAVIVLMATAARWLDAFEGSPLLKISSPWMKAHTTFLYYSLGILGLLVCLGIGACVASICFRGNAGVAELFGPPGLHPILIVDFLDFGALAGAGEAAPVLLLIALVVLGLLAFVGVFYGMILSFVIFKRITQRHYHIVQKKLLTRDYEVVDLDELDEEDPGGARAGYKADEIPESHHARLRGLGLL